MQNIAKYGKSFCHFVHTESGLVSVAHVSNNKIHRHCHCIWSTLSTSCHSPRSHTNSICTSLSSPYHWSLQVLCSYLCDQWWELTTLQCSRSQAQSGAAWSWCTRHGRAAQWWATSSPVNPDTHWGTRVKKSYHSELSRCSHRVLWTKTYTVQKQGAMIIHLSQERYSWQMISSGEVRHHHTNDSTVRQGTMAFCSDY